MLSSFFRCRPKNCLDVIKFTKFLNEEVQIKNKKIHKQKIKKIISAIIIPHVFGNMTTMDKIVNLCKKYNIKVIEDAAEAIEYMQKKVDLKINMQEL